MSETEDDESSEPNPGPEATWRLVLANWDDPAAHKRFVTLCHATGALAYAGGKYREVLNAADGRETGAREQIDAVISLAAADLFAHRPPNTRRAPIARIVLTLISAGALLYTLRLLMGFL
jgi:hypothetical protein